MRLGFTALLIFSFGQLFAQSLPEMRQADKLRIREAINISNRYGDRLFAGYSATPFAIVLVTDSVEFLIHHPDPSTDFRLLGYDSLLKSKVYCRKAQFNAHLLATFPTVNGRSCIVVGTPENTRKTSSEWIITLLHEHFHQYQNAYPDYFQSVDDLHLSGGDQTGMWMLNYPFPYDSIPVVKQYSHYTKALYRAVANIDAPNADGYLKQYFLARKKFRNTLSPAAYRYFSFQVWQEGLARNTEYAFLKMLQDYTPSKEASSLPDFVPFSALQVKMYSNEMENVLNSNLYENKRVSFYSVGFAEGLLLDDLSKHWREKYLADKFYIEHYSQRFR